MESVSNMLNLINEYTEHHSHKNWLSCVIMCIVYGGGTNNCNFKSGRFS